MSSSKPIQIRLDNIQFSWVFAFEKDDNDKYRVTGLIDKKDQKTAKVLIDAIKAAYAQAVADPKIWNGAKPKVFKNPFKDGDKPNDDGSEVRDELKGKWHFTASSNKPFIVMDKFKKVLTSDDDFYSGAIGSIALTVKGYKDKSVGIGIYVNAIVKTAEGERFGGGSINMESVFGDLLKDADPLGDVMGGDASSNSTGADPFGFDGGGAANSDSAEEEFNPWAM